MNHSSDRFEPLSKRPHVGKLDTVFAWCSIAVGFLLVQILPVTQNPLGSVLFVWLLFAFGGIYLRCSGIKPTALPVFFAALGCLLSIGFVTASNAFLRTLLFLFVLLLFSAFLYTACGLQGTVFSDSQLFLHAVYAFAVLPAKSLGHIFFALIPWRNPESGKRILRTVGWIFLGLGLAVVPTAAVILLLSYDDGFIELLAHFFPASFGDIWGFVGDAFWGFLAAIVLFGSLFGMKRERLLCNGEAKKQNGFSVRLLPKTLLCVAVTPVLLVYVIFFVSQWQYYISAFTHTLPADLTYADYARNGFFELCWVCIFNAVMLLLFNLLIRRDAGERGALRRIYSAVISVFTLVLIATALAKLVLYISNYGLTQKRVYAAWLMLLLGTVFVLALIKQIALRFRFVLSVMLAFVLLFGAIALPDVESMIASYNVDAYLDGRLTDVDVEMLADYGASSVPALTVLRDALWEDGASFRNREELLQKTEQALQAVEEQLAESPGGVFSFHLPTQKAKRLLQSEN